MASQHPILFLVFLLISMPFISCHNVLQEDNIIHHHEYYINGNIIDDFDDEVSGLYGGGSSSQAAYPSYFSSIFDDQVSSFKRFDKLGCPLRACVDVDGFGAKGDGKTDDTQAFVKAWKAVCSSKAAILVVPEKTYRLRPITFSGPCQSDVILQVYGTIEASDNRGDYTEDPRHWLVFDSVENLLVQGGGTINGNGNIWWQNSCKINKSLPCKDAPTALTFHKCKNLMVRSLKIQDAQQIHVSFQGSINVQASNLFVTAPKESPNTDGIHVTETQNIQITSSVIGTGDDCISIANGSQNVLAQDITCGPGHGISIGSLGSGSSEAYVSGVTVIGAKFSGTTNGVRIKTWQGGSGSASNIEFKNISMYNVTNPIIIDQNYCAQHKPCKQQKSAVQIENVMYQNIKGTSASDVAINFDCSESFPCQGIVLEDISLVRQGGKAAEAVCNNVNLAEFGVVSPQCP
ncbi:polygalacturonase-like [Tripterygium wilfordii]|uniref:polygalacturonase-like n=1 Tax=Tripterygium wilfordii TaxID=458696 RepID=UPI0018F82DEA|nr:polygalacturonase-like [Tripterygium wilfordii]